MARKYPGTAEHHPARCLLRSDQLDPCGRFAVRLCPKDGRAARETGKLPRIDAEIFARACHRRFNTLPWGSHEGRKRVGIKPVAALPPDQNAQVGWRTARQRVAGSVGLDAMSYKKMHSSRRRIWPCTRKGNLLVEA